MNNKTGSDFCPTAYIALTAVLADANDLFTSLGGTEKGNESFFAEENSFSSPLIHFGKSLGSTPWHKPVMQ